MPHVCPPVRTPFRRTNTTNPNPIRHPAPGARGHHARHVCLPRLSSGPHTEITLPCTITLLTSSISPQYSHPHPSRDQFITIIPLHDRSSPSPHLPPSAKTNHIPQMPVDIIDRSSVTAGAPTGSTGTNACAGAPGNAAAPACAAATGITPCCDATSTAWKGQGKGGGRADDCEDTTTAKHYRRASQARLTCCSCITKATG